MHYCYSCNRNVDSTVKMIQESYRDRGKLITVSKLLRICDRCGKELPDNKINDNNVRKAFSDYQQKLLDKAERKNKRKRNSSRKNQSSAHINTKGV